MSARASERIRRGGRITMYPSPTHRARKLTNLFCVKPTFNHVQVNLGKTHDRRSRGDTPRRVQTHSGFPTPRKFPISLIKGPVWPQIHE